MTDAEPVARVGDWIALYGSLMRGLEGAAALALGDRLRYAGPCILAGELFDLGAYHALRPGNGRVVGELHALRDLEALKSLDAFEDFRPSEPRASVYLRERVELLEPKGAQAWVYVYNTVPDARRRIPSGDWRAELETRTTP